MFRRKSKTMALLLAVAMVLTSVLGLIPAEVRAATKTMAHLKSGSGNGNNHFGGATPEAFVLSDKADITEEGLNAQVKFAGPIGQTRFRFVNKYANDNQWSYIAYDHDEENNVEHWFYEYKNEGDSGYPDLTGLPFPGQDDVVNISTRYEGDELVIKVDNVTTGESGEARTPAKLKNVEGQVGVGAATYGSQTTEVYFSDISAGTHKWSDYSAWTLYRQNAEGQIWQPATEVEIGGGEEPEPEPEPGKGRKWIEVNSGAGGAGGHSYGTGASGPALLLDQDKTTQQAGLLELNVKPQNDNWGVFYTYKDDNNWLYVGYDKSSQWYFQYKINGVEKYPAIGGLPAPVIGEELQMAISVDRETLSVTVNGVNKKITEQALIDLPTATTDGKFGVMVKGANQKISFSDLKYNGAACMEDTWAFAADRGHTLKETYTAVRTVTGNVTSEDKPLEGATVRFGAKSGKTDASGAYQIKDVEVGTYNIAITKLGYQPYMDEVAVTEEGPNTFDAVLSPKPPLDLSKYDTLQNDQMKVYIGKDFPVVARYELGGKDNFFRGNEGELNTVKINNVSIEPKVKVGETTETSRIYEMHLEKDAINLDMSVKISIDETDLTWEVIEVNKAEDCADIATIDVPQLNLLTIEATEEGADFAGAKKSTATTVSGDSFLSFEDGFVPSETDYYLYAFLTNGKYSAGLHSNSEAEGDLRVCRNNGADTISLTSAPWYYEKGDRGGQSYAKENAGTEYPVSELPCAKVAIGADENGDGDIDWNDGALAFRDVMHYAQGSDVIKDMVNYRIVMNFASMAPNPFLSTADNIKKVYLATDGLPQAVMLKGYGNEGHDSANSEYADIAEREGGVEDFQKLIQIAHDYNTEIGIHVNAQEAYAESKSFNYDMIQNSLSHGWGWLDQSIVIDKLWDLSSQARYKRFVQLFDRINNTDLLDLDWDKGEYVIDSQGTLASPEEIAEAVKNAENNMDFIYLDVWYQNSWETRRIAEEINSLGWRFSTEFSDQGEYDSTWQHWATDASYGGAGMKGFNSDIIRFLRNDQRDSQVLNYPSYGGTADNPLLGGYRLYGFEGWGGDQNYNNYIHETFNQNLPTKFLQHYIVTDWENYADGESPVGNHEKTITLKADPKDPDSDTVVVTRNEAQRGDDNIERTITLNGREVLRDVTYLLPWTDDQDGSEKLYHWNLEGGATTWQLPEGWDSAVMYELTDQGRINETAIGGGSVTIEAKAATPYVLVKGASAPKTLKNDFGEKDYVTDPGFNGYTGAGEALSSDEWSGDIDDSAIVVEKNSLGDQRLAFNSPTDKVSVTTNISGLKAGVDYVAEVNIENNSDAKAYIKVNNGEEEVSNYTERSNARNYIQCDIKSNSNMQRMQISFVAKGENAELTLIREGGEGSTYVDDIRIVEKKLDNFKEDGSFEQDFENVVQGIYPFVLGSAQGRTDPRTHLSQRNGDYTQKGFGSDVNPAYEKPIDDVLNGEWSLKHHEISGGIVYQTIPQNFRFEPGKVYNVEFKYQSALGGAYAMVIGDGLNYTTPADNQYLEQARGKDETKTVKMQVVGSGSGQTWIGLYLNSGKLTAAMPDLDGNGTLDLEKNLGYQDFVLDDLKITEDPDAVAVSLEKTDLFLGETAGIFGSNLDKIEWTSSAEDVVSVDKKAGKISALKAGVSTLTATAEGEVIAEFGVTVSDSVVVEIPREEYSGITSTANTEEIGGEPEGSGVASAASDGDSSTYWHSQWNGSGFVVSSDNPAIMTVDLGAEMEIDGFRFQQRPSANNGLVEQFKYIIKDADGNVLEEGTSRETIEPERAGGAWITVQTENHTNARIIEIYVEAGRGNFAAIAEVQPIRVEKVATEVTLDDASLKVGETKTLVPTPINGTMLKGLVWESSDDEIVTVKQNGTVKALKEGEAEISVSNAAGLKASCKVTVEAGEIEEHLPTVPENITSSKVTDSSVTISWNPSENAEEYVVYVDGKEYNTVKNTKITITGLKAETTYKIEVKAKNAFGISDAAALTITTDKKSEESEDTEKPTKPENLKASDIRENNIEVKWNASKDNVGVTGYVIYLNGEKVGTVNADYTGALINNLKAGTKYTIGVAAFDAAGNESDMATVTVTTKGKAGVNDKDEENKKPGVEPVKTGDSSPILLLVIVLVVAGGAIAFVIYRKQMEMKKRRARRRHRNIEKK